MILCIYHNSIYSFFLDAWLFLSPLFQYVQKHSTIGVPRTLHKWSIICFAFSNDQCFGICSTKLCSKLIWQTCCFDSQSIWKWLIMLESSVSILQEVNEHYRGIPRGITKNTVEGWHIEFQAHVSGCCPVFWKFLEVLQKEETVVRVEILQNQVGNQPPPQRRRYVDCMQPAYPQNYWWLPKLSQNWLLKKYSS